MRVPSDHSTQLEFERDGTTFDLGRISMKTQRGPGKPFKAGNQFGKGRPVGSRNNATIAMEALLDGEGDAIMRKVVELAKAGNETALRLCMDRLIPPRRERLVQVTLPSDITTAEGTAGVLAAVLQAAAQGEITPGEAVQLSNVLDVRRKAIETQELADRVLELGLTIKAMKIANEDYTGGDTPGPGSEGSNPC